MLESSIAFLSTFPLNLLFSESHALWFILIIQMFPCKCSISISWLSYFAASNNVECHFSVEFSLSISYINASYAISFRFYSFFFCFPLVVFPLEVSELASTFIFLTRIFLYPFWLTFAMNFASHRDQIELLPENILNYIFASHWTSFPFSFGPLVFHLIVNWYSPNC